jgi:hypothetical protein
MDMMMALRAHARGGPEELVYEQAPVTGVSGAWAGVTYLPVSDYSLLS